MKKAAITLLFLFCLSALSVIRADTDLEISMKHMSKAFKQLTLDLKSPQDASKADYLALAATLKTEAQKARNLTPKKAADLPADQQATMVAAYQKSMDDFSAQVDVLTQDLQNGQWADASKQLDVLKKSMIDGHKQFRKKEGKDAASAPAPASTPAPAPAAEAPATNAPPAQ